MTHNYYIMQKRIFSRDQSCCHNVVVVDANADVNPAGDVRGLSLVVVGHVGIKNSTAVTRGIYPNNAAFNVYREIETSCYRIYGNYMIILHDMSSSLRLLCISNTIIWSHSNGRARWPRANWTRPKRIKRIYYIYYVCAYRLMRTSQYYMCI